MLAAAAKQIRAHGPYHVAVTDVMKGAGLTHGGFYAHFKSKDALVAAAIEQMFVSASARWARETANRTPVAGLAAYLAFYLSPEHRDARGSGCPMPALAGDSPRLRNSARNAFAIGRRRLVDNLADCLKRLGHDEPVWLAMSVFAELVGALALARAEPDRERSDAILAASLRSLRSRLRLS